MTVKLRMDSRFRSKQTPKWLRKRLAERGLCQKKDRDWILRECAIPRGEWFSFEDRRVFWDVWISEQPTTGDRERWAWIAGEIGCEVVFPETRRVGLRVVGRFGIVRPEPVREMCGICSEPHLIGRLVDGRCGGCRNVPSPEEIAERAAIIRMGHLHDVENGTARGRGPRTGHTPKQVHRIHIHG